MDKTKFNLILAVPIESVWICVLLLNLFVAYHTVQMEHYGISIDEKSRGVIFRL